MISRDGDDVLIRIKVVPGASGNGIAGVLGDRLKVRVSAPAEGGRANKVCLRGDRGGAQRQATAGVRGERADERGEGVAYQWC